MPDKTIYRLSDMFQKTTDSPELELMVTVLNVNAGRNPKLMKACKSLEDYSIFVSKVRKYIKEEQSQHSDDEFKQNKKAIIKCVITKAVDECIEEGILKHFFIVNREEAIDMGTAEYSIEKDWQVLKDGYFESGIKATTSLFAWLLDNNRRDDIDKATRDEQYLNSLFEEYNSAKK